MRQPVLSLKYPAQLVADPVQRFKIRRVHMTDNR
jgi:hypothetical protein